MSTTTIPTPPVPVRPIPTPLAMSASQIEAMLARCRKLGGERFAIDVLEQLAELAKRGDA